MRVGQRHGALAVSKECATEAIIVATLHESRGHGRMLLFCNRFKERGPPDRSWTLLEKGSYSVHERAEDAAPLCMS
jgi:hypothetical protein